MKKLLLCAAIAFSAFSAFADLGDDGYYRVQNALSKRYAYLLDNRGSFNVSTSSADVQALELYLDKTRALSDPATVFYINKVNVADSNMKYNIGGQGTSMYSFLGEYLKIIKNKSIDGQQSYLASATKSGLTKYLGDIRSDPEREKGLASADATGDTRLWYINPVDAASDDNYFGVAPTLTAGGKYYYPMYAGFPFCAYSDGVKVYTVQNINPYDAEPAVGLKEVTGTVPEGTAVIIECSNPLPAFNRLNIGNSGSKANVAGNMLKGVYFDNELVTHYNRTAYNPATMRILTVKDGQLVFDVADLDFLPRNQSYLQLSDAVDCAVKTYKVVSEQEYNEKYAGVSSIEADQTVDVYGLDGRLVKAGVIRSDVSSLGKGMYILRSGSASEKLIIR